MSTATEKALETALQPASSIIRWTDRFDHLLARLGVRRAHHWVQPGLYALGSPGPDSPVLVSANYTLSFDALRSSLPGVDAYILVLDTRGVNVWCAAGKGTFGTEEIIRRLQDCGLDRAVRHRTLILPQLAAPGVSAHEVKRRCGFRVQYGPVRAADLPEYLQSGRATAAQRRVRFSLSDRGVLIPVEAVHVLLPLLLVVAVLRLTGMAHHWYNDATAGVLAGVVLFPLLLPWIPTRDFSSKGFLLGILLALPLIARELLAAPAAAWGRLAAAVASHLLIVSAISAFLALNFTGSTTFTSRSGVRREIFRYIPAMAWTFGIGLVLAVLLRIFG